MGFRYFGIEATSPEADDLNRYVEFGEGDPVTAPLPPVFLDVENRRKCSTLFAGCANGTPRRPPGRRCGSSASTCSIRGASIDSVSAFVQRTLRREVPGSAPTSRASRPIETSERTSPRSASSYGATPVRRKDACRAGSCVSTTLLAADSAVAAQATSPAKIAAVIHHARLVQQFEATYSITNVTLSGQARDQFMAENAAWKRGQGGPDARLVLWAHNAHVATMNGQMGGALQAAFGTDYLSLGFLFGTGAFNAVAGPGTGFSGVRPWTASLIPDNSVEALFMRAGGERLLLDARRIGAGGPAAALVGGPLPMRSIGSLYDPRLEQNFFYGQAFPADFQLLLFVRATTATTLLPYLP